MLVLPVVFIIETSSISGRVSCLAHDGGTFVAELWLRHFSEDFQKLQSMKAVMLPVKFPITSAVTEYDPLIDPQHESCEANSPLHPDSVTRNERGTAMHGTHTLRSVLISFVATESPLLSDWL
jgi:hypothetical protein